jgi:hypothetical protein
MEDNLTRFQNTIKNIEKYFSMFFIVFWKRVLIKINISNN